MDCAQWPHAALAGHRLHSARRGDGDRALTRGRGEPFMLDGQLARTKPLTHGAMSAQVAPTLEGSQYLPHEVRRPTLRH